MTRKIGAYSTEVTTAFGFGTHFYALVSDMEAYEARPSFDNSSHTGLVLFNLSIQTTGVVVCPTASIENEKRLPSPSSNDSRPLPPSIMYSPACKFGSPATLVAGISRPAAMRT